MDGKAFTSMSLDGVDSDQFLLGNFTSITLAEKGKQQSNTEERLTSSLKSIKDIRKREDLIIKDLLCIILGREGTFISLTNRANHTAIYKCLKGSAYSIHKDIDINFKDITYQLALLGTKISALENFHKFFDRASHGKVVGRLCEFIRGFFNDYYLLVNQLEHTFENDSGFSIISLYQSLNNIPIDSPYCSIIQSVNHQYELIQQIIEENNKRLENSNLMDMKFKNIMKLIKEDLSTNALDDIIIDSQNSRNVKGGIILNIVQKELDKFKGNDRSEKFLLKIYEFISTDYIEILNTWLHSGIINDPFDEFFIVETKSNANLYNSYYWINKFAIKKDGLIKQLDSIVFQKKVFLSGKYLTIVRECQYNDLLAQYPFTKINSLQDINMEIIINESYVRANKIMRQLFCEGYKLPKFIFLMNKYFLIFDGSLFDGFLNRSNHELKRTFNNASILEISRAYETSYDSKKLDSVERLFLHLLVTKFEKNSLLEDILKIIKTKITDATEIMSAANMGNLTDLLKANLQSNDAIDTYSKNLDLKSQRCNKLTISRFSIDLQLPFPLNQIILESQKLEYQILFRHTALVKFLEKRFEKSWRELGYQTFWTWNFEDLRIRKWIKRCRFIHTKMFDFIRLYSFYLKYDVLETNWYPVRMMLKGVEERDRIFDLSDFKFQLTEFLSSSLSDILLSQTKLTTGLYELFTLMIVFHEYVMSLRKALLLMDESLLDSQKARLHISIDFSPEEKEKTLRKIIEVLDSFHLTFQNKLVELSQDLAYYGGVDSPKMLLLHSKIVSTFKM
jgi:gamma-tubulin complex component 2